MSTPTRPGADRRPLDREFAVGWYQRWIGAWNRNEPDSLAEIVTDDFVLDSPTTRHTGWFVQGPQTAGDYVRYVLAAYPDLIWEVTDPPLFSDDIARAAFSWRGTGHFSGRLDPPGVPGTGAAFAFSGLEVFDFRGDRACYLNASYDLLGLMRQIGVHRGATAEGLTR